MTSMSKDESSLLLTELQWLKIQLRITALEDNGTRLSSRFEFFDDSGSEIICRIYFIDDDSNPVSAVPAEERIEIYEGRIELATSTIRRAIEFAELPPTFKWTTTVRFLLLESYGMGSTLVYEAERTITWPDTDLMGTL